MNVLNWSEISRTLTGNRSQIGPEYKGKKYKSVVSDVKEIENLIKMRIENFNEPKDIDEAIKEIEVIDNIKKAIE